jgi:hypothetical protein
MMGIINIVRETGLSFVLVLVPIAALIMLAFVGMLWGNVWKNDDGIASSVGNDVGAALT